MCKKSFLKPVLTSVLLLGSTGSYAMANCQDLPSDVALRDALKAVQMVDNGGLGLHMWASMVDRDGVVCAVVFSGEHRGDQWGASRVISAQKANTASALSLPGLALSTANLWQATQPGGSLYGLQFSNPVDTAVAYGNATAAHGDRNVRHYGAGKGDPMVGSILGGINVFGGGVALYDEHKGLLGAIGVSGDTACADHNIAWRVRDSLGLDYVPGGVADVGDNMIFDPATGFSHPTRLDPGDEMDNILMVNDCPISDGVTAGCIRVPETHRICLCHSGSGSAGHVFSLHSLAL